MCIRFNRAILIFISILMFSCSSSEYLTPEEQEEIGKKYRAIEQEKISKAFEEDKDRAKQIEEIVENLRRQKEEERQRKEEERKRKVKEQEEIYKEPFRLAIKECEDLGFEKGTESFGQCVLDLTE